jgi:hypothetical protein
MGNLHPDFLDFITLLEKKSVDYLVVGGYAVGFHGFPRYTGDIDFFVAVSETNARRLMEVFQEFGFGEIGIKKQDLIKTSFIIEIGREPQKMRFIGLQELLRNKKASSRSKDLIYAQELSRTKS